MSAYQIDNQWGGSSAPWHQGSVWLLGGRSAQAIQAIDIKSSDNGATFQGVITYLGEGPIGFKAAQKYGNVYACEVQWGGESAPWHVDGDWVIGGRDSQRCVALTVSSQDEGKTLFGSMVYLGEGGIGFRGVRTSSYAVENQWGGDAAPWHAGGTWVLSGRSNQSVVSMDISSKDGGRTLEGVMTYSGEGPIGFRGTRAADNVYAVENQWGGSSAPWHRGGDMILGGRQNQQMVQLTFSSADGAVLSGTMTYLGEGPIGFKASRNPV